MEGGKRAYGMRTIPGETSKENSDDYEANRRRWRWWRRVEEMEMMGERLERGRVIRGGGEGREGEVSDVRDVCRGRLGLGAATAAASSYSQTQAQADLSRMPGGKGRSSNCPNCNNRLQLERHPRATGEREAIATTASINCLLWTGTIESSSTHRMILYQRTSLASVPEAKTQVLQGLGHTEETSHNKVVNDARRLERG